MSHPGSQEGTVINSFLHLKTHSPENHHGSSIMDFQIVHGISDCQLSSSSLVSLSKTGLEWTPNIVNNLWNLFTGLLTEMEMPNTLHFCSLITFFNRSMILIIRPIT